MGRTDLPEQPKEPSRYVAKFEEGTHRYRIISDPVIYWEFFTNDNKPERSKEKPDQLHFEKMCKPGKFKDEKTGQPKKQLDYVWSMMAWDFQQESVVCLSLKKTSLTEGLLNLTRNPEFGDPTKYNIVITRTGKEKETRYEITGGQYRELDKEIQARIAMEDYDITRMLTNDSPFLGQKADTVTNDGPF